jgi:hypothetical protein
MGNREAGPCGAGLASVNLRDAACPERYGYCLTILPSTTGPTGEWAAT